jgi:thymidylate kinase
VEFERCIDHAFGARGKIFFDPASPDLPKKKDVVAYAKRARRGLGIQSLKRAPFAAMGRCLRHWWVEIARVFHPVGLHLVVLGPDGVGKSTVLRGIRERLDGLFVDTHEHHWRPSVLPDIGVATKQRAATSGPVSEPHAKPPHAWPLALARLAYYWLDYWLGWPTRILRRRAQKHLVLFDRYADDMALDPRRYRFGLPRWLLRLAAATTPRPNNTFVLLADAATLAARKGEVSGEEAEALVARYTVFAKGSRRRIAVDNSRPLPEVLDEIEGVVVRHLMQHGIHAPQLRLANVPGPDER